MASLTAALPSLVLKESLRGSNKPVQKHSSTAPLSRVFRGTSIPPGYVKATFAVGFWVFSLSV